MIGAVSFEKGVTVAVCRLTDRYLPTVGIVAKTCIDKLDQTFVFGDREFHGLDTGRQAFDTSHRDMHARIGWKKQRVDNRPRPQVTPGRCVDKEPLIAPSDCNMRRGDRVAREGVGKKVLAPIDRIRIDGENDVRVNCS